MSDLRLDRPRRGTEGVNSRSGAGEPSPTKSQVLSIWDFGVHMHLCPGLFGLGEFCLQLLTNVKTDGHMGSYL